MVSIGDEILDGYKETAGWAGHGVKWLSDIQEFYRERAAIERESAAKLNQLVSKHFSKKAAVSASLSVGDHPSTTPGSLENASATAWMEVLNKTEEVAKERRRLADELGTQIADQISGMHSRFDQFQTQAGEFYTALESDRDASYSAVKKAKHDYDEACQSMEHARAKGKKIETKEQDMVYAKDGYLLAINVANRIKDKYYHDDVPELLDLMQKLNESRTAQLNRAITLAVSLESSYYDRCKSHLEDGLKVVAQNSPELDSAMFVKHNLRRWQDPTDFYFQPSPVWHDDDQMTTDENGLKFLRARMAKADSERERASNASQSALSGYERAKKDADVDFQTLTGSQAAPILKNYIATLRALTRAETQRLALEVEIETIEATTAGHDLSSVPVTRTKTTRTLLGKKKEVVEVVAPDRGPRHSSANSLGLKSLLARGARVAKLGGSSGSGPTARLLYDFSSGGPGELSASAGEILPLVENDDGSGWVKVRRGEDMGLIPAAYAEITAGSVHEAEPDGAPEQSKGAPAPPPSRGTTAAKRASATGLRKMVAVYDYDAADSLQLTIREGDSITVTAIDSGNGWTTGEVNGQTGIFPTSYARAA